MNKTQINPELTELQEIKNLISSWIVKLKTYQIIKTEKCILFLLFNFFWFILKILFSRFINESLNNFYY